MKLLQMQKLFIFISVIFFHKFQINNEQSQQDIVLIQNSISSKRAILLDFHALEISEQLTLQTDWL